MRANDKEAEGPWSEQLLEARLRAIPKPPVPPGLEGRILATIPPARPAAAPRLRAGWRWVAAGAAVAAVVIPAVILAVLRQPPSPQTQESVGMPMSEVDIEQTLEREARAARLLASARILGKQPAGRSDAAKTLSYISRVYADTSAAKTILNVDVLEQGDMQ